MRIAFLLWAAVLALPAAAESHALIMTISAYQAGVPPLHGVAHDGESARSIARRMGVKDANMRHYKDGELTLAGMQRAFDALQERVADGDQVFIYFSGHGGRQLVRVPGERCAESLITVDGMGFIDVELESRLKRLAAKAQKLVVLLDACHSGGVTQRSMAGTAGGKAGAKPAFSAKFFARSGPDACERPINVLTRSLGAASRSAGSGAGNYVYIAAARDNEVSLDMPAKGGVATQAWRDCINGAASDRDGSGGLSAAEIQACAQDKINAQLKGIKGFLPHHVTIAGNPGAVLSFPERSIPVKTSAYNALLDIYNSRDDRRSVSLQSAKSAFRIGRDDVDFSLTSSHAGYAYLLMVGSDGRSFDMLFPNQLDGANAVEAGQTLRLPRPSWQIKAGGPAGRNHLLAIVADSPREFAKIGMQPAGPFSMIAASETSSKDIQLVSTTSAHAASSECTDPSLKRTLQVQKRCSGAYGAAMMVVEEID
jgi:hypothetical protein